MHRPVDRALAHCCAILTLASLVAACSGAPGATAVVTSTPGGGSPAPTAIAPSGSLPFVAGTPAPLDDEAWIVYERDGIRLVHPDGSGDHRLLPDGPLAVHPDWSHDGLQLAFAVDDADSRDIWVAGWDGQDAHRVFDCAAPCVDADGPAFSPDDQTIAFRVFDQVDGDFPGSHLELLDLASGTTTTVLSTTAPEYIGNGTGIRWSADGAALVMDVSTIEHAGSEDERVVRSDIAVVRLGNAPVLERITDLDTFPTYPDWNAEDDMIVFMARVPAAADPADSPFNLFVIQPDGSGLRQLTGDGIEWGPTWSPDGGSVLVTVLDAEWGLGIFSETGPGTDVLDRLGIPGAHPRLRPIS